MLLHVPHDANNYYYNNNNYYYYYHSFTAVVQLDDIQNKYEVERQPIGKGAFGVVRRAQ